MASADLKITSYRLLWGCACFVMWLSPWNEAASADYGAEIALVEGYTSNIFLAPEGFEQSEWLTVIVPRFYTDLERPQYDLEFDYRMEALFYSDLSEFNEAYSDLWARGSFDLVDEKLSLMGLTRFTQVNIDPEGRLPDNNVNLTGNRSDAFAWEIGPRWNQPLLGNSEVDAHYYVGTINYDDADTQGVTTQRAEIWFRTLDRSATPVTYELFYRYQNYDYDVTGVTQFQRLYLELSYSERPLFQPTVIVGSESNLVTNDGLLDEPYWEAGFRSAVRSNIFEAFYGRRFYGPTYRLRWTRTTQKSDFWADYRETQQTPESGAIDDIVADVDAGITPSAGQSLTP
ncbi:MAG: TIGR03016 family PEP-CTERM system-associated outer membrane protein, partial [Gammaproteobacteria bacterium]